MIKYLLTTFLFFYSSVSLATQSEESFHLSCKAEQSQSEESLQANAELTITQRPALGGSITFDYRILTNPLPYQAKVEYDFGETRDDDTWTLYFVSTDSSAVLSRTKASMTSDTNEIVLTSKVSDSTIELIFSCSLNWVE